MGTPNTNERSPSDAALIQRIASGDERALGVLYDRYGKIAYGLATAITGRIITKINTDIFHHCGPRVAFCEEIT